ncbi:uncharacterized protein PG986_006916 [Apiospora aurea]|uniref:Secreted protein n=1 Tax=Apiospora aurea TaxID=335848 RepID=A0ABR1QB24_9PEZI
MRPSHELQYLAATLALELALHGLVLALLEGVEHRPREQAQPLRDPLPPLHVLELDRGQRDGVLQLQLFVQDPHGVVQLVGVDLLQAPDRALGEGGLREDRCHVGRGGCLGEGGHLGQGAHPRL